MQTATQVFAHSEWLPRQMPATRGPVIRKNRTYGSGARCGSADEPRS
jgi:hypothetical protein